MDEYGEIAIVGTALRQLQFDDVMWNSNYRNFTFGLKSDEHRIIWWRRAKKQAEAGVPAMQQLLLKVIELRMTS